MYRLKIKSQAEKDFAKLPPKIAGQVRRKIDALAAEPRPNDHKKLLAMPGRLRVDSGEYRILYEIDDKAQIVTIARIRHRREAYR